MTSGLTTQDWQECTAALANVYDRKARCNFYRAPRKLVRFARPFLENGMTVLDLGAGTGQMAEEIARTGLEVIIDGVDRSEHMLAKARQKGRYRYLIPSDIAHPKDIRFPQARYDAVVSAGVYGDYVNPAILPQMLFFLKDRGIIAVAGEGYFSDILLRAGVGLRVDKVGLAFMDFFWVPTNYNYCVGIKDPTRRVFE